MAGTEGLYEVCVGFESNIYRIFCCFDKGNLIILLNGFQKKTQKTPKKEIDLTLKLKEEYLNSKKGKQWIKKKSEMPRTLMSY